MNTVTEQYALQFVRKKITFKHVFLIKYVFKKLCLDVDLTYH